jgi:hypothetical protein
MMSYPFSAAKLHRISCITMKYSGPGCHFSGLFPICDILFPFGSYLFLQIMSNFANCKQFAIIAAKIEIDDYLESLAWLP